MWPTSIGMPIDYAGPAHRMVDENSEARGVSLQLVRVIVDVAKHKVHLRRVLVSLWPYFRALQHCPVLVIRGALSEFLSEKSVERMQKSKPDMRVAVVPNRGHAPILNEPEATRAIDEFLEEIDHGRAGHETAKAR